MAKYLVCVSDERHASYEIERAILEKAGAELKLCHCESAADIAAQCADADAVLLDLAPMTAEAVAGLRKCKVISRYGVGFENVDLDADNTFKLTSQKDWDGTNYGYASDTELSTDGGAGNLSVTETGFYRIEANLSTLTYKFSKTEWGIIGDATQGGWDNSTPMTLNAETGEWSITTELAAGNYKFRANNKWDINLGGDLNHLTYGGDNITTEAGTYVITLKLGDASNYHATVVKR